MIEKPKIVKIDKNEMQMPRTIEELIQMYSLDEIWSYINKIIEHINKEG